jgi:hypothetical protein
MFLEWMYIIKPYMHVQYINCTLFTLWFKILFGFQECSTHLIIDSICLRDIIQIIFYRNDWYDAHVHKNCCIKSLIWSAFNNLPCIFIKLGKGRGFIYICWPNRIQFHRYCLNWIKKKRIARYIYTWVYYFMTGSLYNIETFSSQFGHLSDIKCELKIMTLLEFMYIVMPIHLQRRIQRGFKKWNKNN